MMMSMQALLLLSVVSAASAEVFTDDQASKVEVFVEEVMRCRQIPGLTLAVVKGGETWTRGFGKADIEKGVNVTKDTLFVIGSLTKAFSSTLLAMMIDESNGSLKWTSKLKDILGPDFSFVDDERTRETTLRDILTHRTGLNRALSPLFAGFDHNVTRTEFARGFRFLEEEKPFRDVFKYNNWPYALLGPILEVLTGESYEATLEKRIFKPLGMKQSRVLGKTITTNSKEMAQPYYDIDNELVLTDSSIYDIHPSEAAGAIVSSAEDMAKWMHFLLREGVTEDNATLVKSKTLAETFKSHQSYNSRYSFTMPKYPATDLYYGYGYAWVLAAYKGYRKVRHSGGLYSYVTYLTLLPDLDVGIFSSANGPGTRDEGTGEKMIAHYISDILIGDQPWLNSSTACTFPLPWEEVSEKGQNNSDITNSEVECLNCYVGTYGNYMFGDLAVVESSGSSLELHYGRVQGSLNTTVDKRTFKLDIFGSFRLLARPGNTTYLAKVIFRGLNEGKYSNVDLFLFRNLTFTRGISFHDKNKYTSEETGTNGQSAKKFSDLLVVITVLCIIFWV